ncbi:MAG: non-canonical purine NTP pyrophosphatase [bacterium]|nr:non-canonical purine NTP pyrophosphatase [bacterium]
MQKVVIATANEDKVRELRAILSGTPVKIVTPDDLGGMPETEETAASYAGNALLKACAARDLFDLPAIADDSGLEVEELEGAPGVYSSRFAGPDCSYDENNTELLREMEEVPERDRLAQFTCVAALVLPNGKEYVFTGILPGVIAT